MKRTDIRTLLGKSIWTILLALQLGVAAGQVSGVVMDTKGSPLPDAVVYIMPEEVSASTDGQGRFTLNITPSGKSDLIVHYIGYEADTIRLSATGDWDGLEITLYTDQTLLETIVVTEEHAKQEELLQTEHVHSDFLRQNLQGSFAKSIEKLPGISAINVGVGIAKPVIRGLSANRIIVNHQGIKQESQQWGSDHGLEVDQFDVERVEIVKGPGSLQYGSDGLGGVINIMPDKILPKNTYSGSLVGVHKTNNEHWGGSAKLGVNLEDWFLTARYSAQDFADYSVPANTFTYNSFDLPILNNRLKNTAGNESNISLTTGLRTDKSITRVLYSHYSLDAGLFSGAVGVPRAYALSHDGNYRDIDVPMQAVDHYRLSLSQTIFFGNDHIAIDAGWQRNDRREFSQPEFHSIPLSQLSDPNDKLAIRLLLETISVDAHYEHNADHGWKQIVGFNTQWQDNQRGGFEYLLPDFKTFRGGIYSIVEKEISEAWLVSGGLRADIGSNQTDKYRQFIWDSNENIIDSLISLETDDRFFNWSASLGSNLVLGDGRWVLKANAGKSFRVPYPSETVSNGIHHGTFRHEVGTPDLQSEHGYQLDLGATYSSGQLSGGLAVYFNYFDNYIYLGPTFPAKFSRLPEAGQIFQYRQDDAIYTGFELQYDWDINSKWEWSQVMDYVQSYNPETGLALPFTPQPAIKSDLKFMPTIARSLRDSYVRLGHEHHFAAEGRWRTDRSERPTPGYTLFNVGLGTSFDWGQQSLHLDCQVQNLLNTKYLAHLSRYRIINIPEQGRNIVVSIKVPFEGKF